MLRFTASTVIHAGVISSARTGSSHEVSTRPRLASATRPTVLMLESLRADVNKDTDGRRGGGPSRLPAGRRGPASALLRQAKNEDAVAVREAELEVAARGDGDELLPVDLERDRGGVDAGAALEPP